MALLPNNQRDFRTRFVLFVLIPLLSLWFVPKLWQLFTVWLSLEAVYSDDVFSQVTYVRHCPAMGLFPGDPLAQYAVYGLMPAVYRWLYCGVAYLGDPLRFSQLLSVGLFFVSAAALGRAAWHCGNSVTVALSLAWFFASDFLLLQIAGGLPHSFTIPLLAVWLYAVLVNSWRLLWCLVIVSACFYPVLTPLFGVYLCIAWCILPLLFPDSKEFQAPKNRLLLLFFAAALSFLVALPTLLESNFGERITPAVADAFPEAGAGGRYDSFSRPPFPPLWREFTLAIDYSFFHGGRSALVFFEQFSLAIDSPIARNCCYALFLLGILVLPGKRRLRVISVLLAAAITYFLALIVYPYLYFPGRAIEHCTSVLALLLLPQALTFLLEKIFLRDALPHWLRQGAFYGVLVALCAAIAALDGVFMPIAVVRPSSRPLFSAIEKLPADVVIAGWMEGVVNQIPYATGRSVYISYETHQALHTRHTEILRGRAIKVIDALFSCDDQGIDLLRRDGVTHLVIEKRWFDRDTPHYFEPFSATLQRRYEENRHCALDRSGLTAAEIVFSNEEFTLLDLQKISG